MSVGGDDVLVAASVALYDGEVGGGVVQGVACVGVGVGCGACELGVVDGGFAYVLRFTGSNGEMGADEAAARVREYGGSCWGLDEAVECERALNERFPLSDGKLV